MNSMKNLFNPSLNCSQTPFSLKSLITQRFPQNSHECALKLTDLWITSLLFDLNSTWSYENRFSKHFVIFLNFPCLIACLLCCLLMSYFFGLSCGQGFVQKWMQTELLSYPASLFLFLTHNSLFNTSDCYLKSVRA